MDGYEYEYRPDGTISDSREVASRQTRCGGPKYQLYPLQSWITSLDTRYVPDPLTPPSGHLSLSRHRHNTTTYLEIPGGDCRRELESNWVQYYEVDGRGSANQPVTIGSTPTEIPQGAIRRQFDRLTLYRPSAGRMAKEMILRVDAIGSQPVYYDVSWDEDGDFNRLNLDGIGIYTVYMHEYYDDNVLIYLSEERELENGKPHHFPDAWGITEGQP